MKKPSAFLCLCRKHSPAARAFAGAIAALLVTQFAAAATTHTWNAGDAPNTTSWSTPLNWSDAAAQTFLAGDTFDLSTLNITADSISTVDANATLGIINIGDATTGSNAWTLNNSGGAVLTLDNSGTAQINQTSTSFGDSISVPLLLNNPLTVTNASTNALTLAGDITILGATGSKNLTLSGTGTLILKGNNVTNPGGDTRGGNITVTGEGTLKITAGLTNALAGSNGNREGGQMIVGTSTSGGNHLEVTAAGKAKSGSMLVGQGTSGSSLYGSNTVIISTPGNSGAPSYTTGTNGGNYYVGVYSPHNSLTVSNGAYITQSNGGGTANSYIGQYPGSDYNSMTLTDANTRLAHSGQRLYVGGDGSHNSLLVKLGAQVTNVLKILQIGGNSAAVASTDNSVTVTNANSIVNATQQFFIGLTANSTNNSMLISDGGSFVGSINGVGRSIIGAAAGANNNSITVTGALSTLNISTGVLTAQLALACSSATTDPSVAADSNHLDVVSGATANLSIPVKLGGTNSKFNLGDGTGTSTAKIGMATSTLGYLVNLSSVDAQLNINGGKLLALVGGVPMVTGAGTVHLNGPAIFDSGTGAFANSISSVISGSGSLTKAGGDSSTLTLAADTNTYSGDTILGGGTLELLSANPNNQASAVSIDTSHSKLYLNFVGDDVVGSLVINGATMPTGTYGSSSSIATIVDDNAFAGTGTLTVSGAAPAPTYAEWASSKGIPGAPAGGDADNDGVPNAVEMVLGGNPNGGMDVGLLPELALVSNPAGVAAGDYLEFTYRRTHLSVDAGLVATCEYGLDLVSPWTPAVNGENSVTVLVDIAYVSYSTAAPTDRVRVYVPRASNAKLFGRLNVSVP